MKLFLFLFPFLAFANTENCLKNVVDAPAKLSETCLYKDLNHHLIADDIIQFTPNYALWTDGASKRRWIYLPRNSKINNDDQNNWIFPVGTVIWKEFSIDGLVVETRFLKKKESGKGLHKWLVATYQWEANQVDAIYIPNGLTNTLGTTHDIPSIGMCFPCHRGAQDAILGFSALQLSIDDNSSNSKGWYLKALVEKNYLTNTSNKIVKIPGTKAEQKVIGYLHANCGHCHTDNHMPGRRTGLLLQHDVFSPDFKESPAIKTSLNIDTVTYPNIAKRIQPGAPQKSALYTRLNSNSPGDMMPPFAKEKIDHKNVKVIRDWINSLR